MLAEGIARERYEMEVREKAQEKVRAEVKIYILYDFTRCTYYLCVALLVCAFVPWLGPLILHSHSASRGLNGYQ